MNLVENKYYRYKVSVVSASLEPQKLVYAALHQCYSSDAVVDLPSTLTEIECGNIAVKRLLAGNRGEYSPLEFPTITLSLAGVPTTVLNQLTRHRVGTNYAVQSHRYTYEHLLEVSKGDRDIEEVIYLRPCGVYRDREGNTRTYGEQERADDLEFALMCIDRYIEKILSAVAPEDARGLLPFDYRTNLLIGLNMRSLMHICDVRLKKNVQHCTLALVELVYLQFCGWSPQISVWYEDTRKGKALLAP